MVNKGRVFRQSDAPPAAAVRDLLVLCLPSFIVYRFVDCLPPETTCIARLTARYAQPLFSATIFVNLNFIINLS